MRFFKADEDFTIENIIPLFFSLYNLNILQLEMNEKWHCCGPPPNFNSLCL